jgi:hypothetical protein
MKTLKQLITESVNEYLREIEEAGNVESMEAKIGRCEEAIAVRESKINKEGIEEAMHDMIDPKKIKELQKEVKVIEKTLKKYQKQLEKLKSKNKHVGAEDTEDSTEESEEIIDENEEFGPSGKVELIPQLPRDYEDEDDDDEYYDADGTPNEDGDFDSKGNPISSKAIDQAMHRGESDRDNMYLNESFLYMQKLAGLITEGQYRAKSKKF